MDHVASARARVERQYARIARLEPGSRRYAAATSALSRFEASLEAVETTELILAAARRPHPWR